MFTKLNNILFVHRRESQELVKEFSSRFEELDVFGDDWYLEELEDQVHSYESLEEFQKSIPDEEGDSDDDDDDDYNIPSNETRSRSDWRQR